MHLHQLGALVSAGFEVSAIVGENLLITSSNTKSENITLAIEPSTDAIDDLEKQKQDHTARNDDARDSNIDINNKKIRSLNQTTLTLSEQQQHQIEQNKLVEQCSCRSSGENCAPGQDENNLLNSMDVWLEHCQRHEISTDAHSPRESVHAAMKHSHICFDTLASNTNDDANTMAERDVGSTFLLPHTHLYKSDKQGSDISGFDSF
uniref:Phosphomethylpyrimidine synthase n=2 Tax=Zeugodacus cucurbitae TaxID=28588 RepID=A0A0A1X0T7_ZEUCU